VPFDVYGRNGNYFMNNVWGWHPLWQFACEQCPDILTQEGLELGACNQGHFINAEKAARLGEQFLQCCVSGVAEATKKNDNRISMSSPMRPVNSVMALANATTNILRALVMPVMVKAKPRRRRNNSYSMRRT
jgi:hypothetical protein